MRGDASWRLRGLTLWSALLTFIVVALVFVSPVASRGMMGATVHDGVMLTPFAALVQQVWTLPYATIVAWSGRSPTVGELRTLSVLIGNVLPSLALWILFGRRFEVLMAPRSAQLVATFAAALASPFLIASLAYTGDIFALLALFVGYDIIVRKRFVRWFVRGAFAGGAFSAAVALAPHIFAASVAALAIAYRPRPKQWRDVAVTAGVLFSAAGYLLPWIVGAWSTAGTLDGGRWFAPDYGAVWLAPWLLLCVVSAVISVRAASLRGEVLDVALMAVACSIGAKSVPATGVLSVVWLLPVVPFSALLIARSLGVLGPRKFRAPMLALTAGLTAVGAFSCGLAVLVPMRDSGALNPITEIAGALIFQGFTPTTLAALAGATGVSVVAPLFVTLLAGLTCSVFADRGLDRLERLSLLCAALLLASAVVGAQFQVRSSADAQAQLNHVIAQTLVDALPPPNTLHERARRAAALGKPNEAADLYRRRL